MNLREMAEQDLSITLEDDVNGFNWPITVEDPDGNTADLIGNSGDIGMTIDPNTGLAVSGRIAHVVLRISSIVAGGLSGLPRGQADKTKKPWKFTFNDLAATSYVFIVRQAMPDRTLGVITCVVEAYKES